MIIEIVVFFFFVALSAFSSCAETAFMAVSSLKVETLAKEKVKGAQTLLHLKQKPREFIITILIGNNIVNAAAASLATVLATSLFDSNGVVIATGITAFIILTFGEIIPKSFATSHAEPIALFLAPMGIIAIKVLYPFVIIFEWLTKLFLKMFGGHKAAPLYSESELRTLVELGVRENRLGNTEKVFIEGILDFKQNVVKDVMTPKRRMFSLDENLTVEAAVHEINKREHTRTPIYSGSKENIVGIVYLKDLLQALAEHKQEVKIREIAKKPLFVEENYPIKRLFKELKGRHVHIAIALNKKRELKGLVTMEDIIEEIVGDIFDEKDISPTLIKRIKKNIIIVHGDTEIEDINAFFNIRLPYDQKINTLNQFLETLKKKEWQEGMKVRFNELTFIIREVEEKKPVKIFIEKK
ncbi:HlyC/CorC family transporter [Candidatus Woesearchaeota archaeon]|nr:HlyC/CorC family transporter [Candidatus Woesearchaeota archaeon]